MDMGTAAAYDVGDRTTVVLSLTSTHRIFVIQHPTINSHIRAAFKLKHARAVALAMALVIAFALSHAISFGEVLTRKRAPASLSLSLPPHMNPSSRGLPGQPMIMI